MSATSPHATDGGWLDRRNIDRPENLRPLRGIPMWLCRTSAICAFVAITLGCGGIGGRVWDEAVVGGMSLQATDQWEQMELTDSEGRKGVLVPSTVFAIGSDGTHVVAKRHPPSPTGTPNDKTKTEYFIVTVREKRVYGPFNRAEYDTERQRLNVAADLSFTQTFQEVE